MADHDETTAHSRATAGLPHPAEVHSWQSLTDGYSDVMLEPGEYRFVGSATYSLQAIVERIPEGEPVWNSADDSEPTREPARVVLAPVAVAGATLTVTSPAEYRISRGPGHLNLTRI